MPHFFDLSLATNFGYFACPGPSLNICGNYVGTRSGQWLSRLKN